LRVHGLDALCADCCAAGVIVLESHLPARLRAANAQGSQGVRVRTTKVVVCRGCLKRPATRRLYARTSDGVRLCLCVCGECFPLQHRIASSRGQVVRVQKLAQSAGRSPVRARGG
jgi:hypothetical protein